MKASEANRKRFCPTCKAKPGEACKTTTGIPMNGTVHRFRKPPPKYGRSASTAAKKIKDAFPGTKELDESDN